MKNTITALTALMIIVAPVLAADVSVPVPVGGLGPGNYGPDVYLAYRTVDIGIDVDGSGSTINPSDYRPGLYAFTGEKIYYWVVVRDDNGVDDIQLVKWVKDGGDEEGPCDLVEVTGNGKDAYYLIDGEKHYIYNETNLQFDDQTDAVFKCILTVESQWSGSLIYVVAEDTSGASGQTLEENWNFNPPITVDISTSDDNPIWFGEIIKDQDTVLTDMNCVRTINEDLTERNCTEYIKKDLGDKKCDISFSGNKLIVTNDASPVNLWLFIAAENFYDSTGMAKCPFTNELHANQFEYRAISGSYDSGWRIMPQYSPILECMGIDLGSSGTGDIFYGQCRGGCRIPLGSVGPIPGLDILSPGQTIEVMFKIVWPTPCIGDFDTGNFYIIARAV